MCDQDTLADWALSRRGFAGAMAAGAGLLTTPAEAAASGLAEATMAIKTHDGVADAFLVRPAKGEHPGILMWPDIAGLREAYQVMARRLAGAGFAVLAVNQYYRAGKAPLMRGITEYFSPAGQARVKPWLEALTPAAITADAAAYAAFLGAQPGVSRAHGLGTVGYCIGGQYALRTAAAAPERVRAVASLHGAALVTGAPDSPDKAIAHSRASFLFAIARNDDAKSPADKDALRAAATAAHRPAEIEVYHADHGWCALDAPAYNQAEAERAWGRMLHLFASL